MIVIQFAKDVLTLERYKALKELKTRRRREGKLKEDDGRSRSASVDSSDPTTQRLQG
jgi:hypothetical protein